MKPEAVDDFRRGCLSLLIVFTGALALLAGLAEIFIRASPGEFERVHAEGGCEIGAQFFAGPFDVSREAQVVCSEGGREQVFRISSYKSGSPVLRLDKGAEAELWLCPHNSFAHRDATRMARRYHRFAERTGAFPIRFVIDSDVCSPGALDQTVEWVGFPSF